ncbi:uncharacterized protein LOC119523054 isoform X2 [Choloepus didactylus]|uniref:uncharacterized protein LOC119523054 isoform X2 n=1 Tax=Choloepus didactylus TaxID=27675 RepID=UPI0018A050FE|nr:uncharacterized protein LOC119523054 isoform X2 [Choloepus didactylus]
MGCLELAFRGPGNGASWGRPGVAGNPGLGVSSSRLKSPLSPRLRGAGASAWELFGPFRRRGPSGSQGRLGPAVFAELRLLAAAPARFPGLESPELATAVPCLAPGPLRPPIRRRKRRTGTRIRLSSPLGIREASPDPPSASLPASFLPFLPTAHGPPGARRTCATRRSRRAALREDHAHATRLPPVGARRTQASSIPS